MVAAALGRAGRLLSPARRLQLIALASAPAMTSVDGTTPW
jgi:hypothetical protein